MKNNKKGLGVRDLVTVGIFTAVYFVMFFISASFGMIPFMAVFYPVLSAFLAGIPMILFLTKAEKFGMVTIHCTIQGIINAAMGFGFQSIIFAIIVGAIADLILHSSKTKSFKKVLFSYIVYSQWVVGTMLPMFIFKEKYLEPFTETQGEEFISKTLNLLNNNWMPVIVIVLIAVFATLGAYVGKAVLKKHFIKAGIV